MTALPDIDVELDPRAASGSRHALEKGIVAALDAMQQRPVPEIKRPKFPVSGKLASLL